MSTYGRVDLYLQRHIPRGSLLTAKDLLSVASRSNADQLLSWFVRARLLRRLSRGVYFRPVRHDSPLRPTLTQIVRFRAEAKGERLQTHGADAARSYGFATCDRLVDAAPARFYAGGRTRTLTIAGTPVRFQHVPDAILSHPFTPVGEALAALHHVGAAAVPAVRARLAPDDRERLRGVMPSLPDRILAAWHALGEAPRDPRRLQVVAGSVSGPPRSGPGGAFRRPRGAPSPRR